MDPISATGLAYPIAKDLYRYAKRLKRAYHEIQHAKESLKKVIEKIEIVAETYMFFKDTMDDAKKIKDMAQTFKLRRNLIRKVKSEAKQIIAELKALTNIFSPLLQNSSRDSVQKWITQFQWYRKEKSAVVPLLMDMRILQGSMDLVATLVTLQMLKNSYQNAESGRDSIHMQIKHLRRLTEIGLKKLQEDEKAQKEILKKRLTTAKQDDMALNLALQIIRILEKEIPGLYRNQPPDSQPTPVPATPSSSSAPPQITPRTSPSLGSRPDVKGQVSPPLSHQTVWVIDESEQEEGMEDAPPEQGPYVRMPPFGPPEAGPRPRRGRKSLDRPTPSSSGDDQLEKNRARNHQNDYSRHRNRELYSGHKLRAGSRISVYGSEGEVTPTHLMGSAALPQGWQRRKEES
ncbi:predicted protein [Aspergillus nidulans FGSC A4]|uniref:Uncharacterized protein n=1 Tax=Emericella nidulans (strain FGSC A4 / ATCC 38163 / CBS 112.46 / NRRL 194 / M139) TaxID=227321 RepID=Q5AR84_EMENI|nr:hypothetical protein [Aspergillus nidulans FGSC A4]EAA61487.1 predicted protein [Aspergillus nidulans FGSC A4]CBF82346.1 TPA: conserved hypothetical protein [Aspergillus nidulans FGSC A4]|eukprot:XP_682465.1 predicted protein [Aspergillus nidulans FGSC A4]